MKCNYCGNEIPDSMVEQSVCPFCGAQLLDKKETKEIIKDLTSFRGVKLPQTEVDVLKKIELFSEKKFSLVNDIEKSTRLSFSIEDKHVAGMNLYWCRLKKLPNNIGILRNITFLSLMDNELEEIPQTIGDLKSLKYLNLHSNNLKQLPDTFGNLSSLEYLDLWDNNLEDLPESFINIKSLQELNLSKNNLKYLPELIGNLRSLKKLLLFDNKIKELPTSLMKLKNLEVLDIRNNPLNKDLFGKYVTDKMVEDFEENVFKIKK